MGREQDLLEAGRSGDVAIIDKLLSPRTKKTSSIVPLAFSSLRRGPSPNAQDTNGDTALHLAALNGHREAVMTLLSYDASANIVDNTGCYPLHLAAWSGNADICDILLTHGPSIAKVNEQNAAGDTALHTAAQYGHVEAVQVLLKVRALDICNQADPTIRNNRDETPLDLASQYGRLGTVESLIRQCPVLLRCATVRHSPLHLASRNGHKQVVEALLSAGFDINTCTENGSALHEAALYGKLEVVQLLLNVGIETSLQDSQGKTALELVEKHTSAKALEIATVIKEHAGGILVDLKVSKSDARASVDSREIRDSDFSVYDLERNSVKEGDTVEPLRSSLPHSDSRYENVPTAIPQPVPPPRKSRISSRALEINDDYATIRKDVQVPVQVIKMERRNSSSISERTSSISSCSLPSGHGLAVEDDDDLFASPSPELPPREYSMDGSSPYLEMRSIQTPATMMKEVPRSSVRSSSEIDKVRSSSSAESDEEKSSYVPMRKIKIRKPSEDNNGAYMDMAKIKPKMLLEKMDAEKSAKQVDNLEDDDDDDNVSSSSESSVGPPADEAEEENAHMYELLSQAHSGMVPSSASSDEGVVEDVEEKEHDSPLEGSTEKSEQEDMEKESSYQTIDDDMLEPPKQISKPPSLEFDNKRSSRASRDMPDKRRSRDMETSTESELLRTKPDTVANLVQDPLASGPAANERCEASVGVHSKSSSIDDESFDSDSSAAEEAEPVQEIKRTEKQPFLGLIKGSTSGVHRRALSQIYDSIVINNRPKRASLSSIPTTFDPLLEKEEGLAPVFKDFDNIVSDIRVHSKNRRSLSLTDGEGSDRRSSERGVENGADEEEKVMRRDNRRTMTNCTSGMDDKDEWAEISDIVQSFGGRMSTSYYADVETFEHEMTTLLRKKASGKVQSVGEWLEGMGLAQYENILVPNGFDDMDFMGSNVLEESDLFEMGIYNDDHRSRILDATKKLPQLQPIDHDDLPETVDDWLKSLHLAEYINTFFVHDFCEMKKVRKMWELELTTVLDITTLGHRKRILASLGNKGNEQDKETLEGLDLSNLTWNLSPFGNEDVFSFGSNSLDSRHESSERKDSLVKDIDLFTESLDNKVSELDQTANGMHDSGVTSGSNSSSDTSSFRREKKHSTDDDNMVKKTNRVSYSGIDIRPPIETMSVANDEVSSWRHQPEVLIKGCCNYVAQYLGSTLIRELQGIESTKESIVKMKKATDQIAKVPSIMLSISFKGVKFIDAKSKKVICEHEIGNIFCACQDAENLNFFAYITKDLAIGKHYCHVFSVRNNDLAAEIILTLGEAFEVAYQVALKERAVKSGREYEQQLGNAERELEAAGH